MLPPAGAEGTVGPGPELQPRGSYLAVPPSLSILDAASERGVPSRSRPWEEGSRSSSTGWARAPRRLSAWVMVPFACRAFQCDAARAFIFAFIACHTQKVTSKTNYDSIF